jgi:hypothetical protein
LIRAQKQLSGESKTFSTNGAEPAGLLKQDGREGERKGRMEVGKKTEITMTCLILYTQMN